MMRLHYLCRPGCDGRTRAPDGLSAAWNRQKPGRPALGGTVPPSEERRIGQVPDTACIISPHRLSDGSVHSEQAEKVQALALQQITKTFGPIRALRGVTLSVAQGEALAVFGPNGAGKTTLLKIAATLMRPSSGSATGGV